MFNPLDRSDVRYRPYPRGHEGTQADSGADTYEMMFSTAYLTACPKVNYNSALNCYAPLSGWCCGIWEWGDLETPSSICAPERELGTASANCQIEIANSADYCV